MQWWAYMDILGLAKNAKEGDETLAFVHSSPLVWSHPHLLDLSSRYQIMLAPIYVLLIFLCFWWAQNAVLWKGAFSNKENLSNI